MVGQYCLPIMGSFFHNQGGNGWCPADISYYKWILKRYKKSLPRGKKKFPHFYRLWCNTLKDPFFKKIKTRNSTLDLNIFLLLTNAPNSPSSPSRFKLLYLSSPHCPTFISCIAWNWWSFLFKGAYIFLSQSWCKSNSISNTSPGSYSVLPCLGSAKLLNFVE